MFNELFKAIYGWVSYSIYQKTVRTTIFRQLVPQKAEKGVGVLRIIQKTVSTAKGVGVSSEKYPKLHLVDMMSDTWYQSVTILTLGNRTEIRCLVYATDLK